VYISHKPLDTDWNYRTTIGRAHTFEKRRQTPAAVNTLMYRVHRSKPKVFF